MVKAARVYTKRGEITYSSGGVHSGTGCNVCDDCEKCPYTDDCRAYFHGGHWVVPDELKNPDVKMEGNNETVNG